MLEIHHMLWKIERDQMAGQEAQADHVAIMNVQDDIGIGFARKCGFRKMSFGMPVGVDRLCPVRYFRVHGLVQQI